MKAPWCFIFLSTIVIVSIGKKSSVVSFIDAVVAAPSLQFLGMAREHDMVGSVLSRESGWMEAPNGAVLGTIVVKFPDFDFDAFGGGVGRGGFRGWWRSGGEGRGRREY